MGRAVMGATSGYEGASTSRRLAGWTETDSAISTLLSTEGDTLRSRSRGLVRKNAWAKNAQDVYVANAIGTGITPEPLHPDRATRTLLKKAWDRSVLEMDADGLTDFYGLQALMLREMFEAGEVLTRFRPRYPSDGLYVPLQLQLLEAEHLSLTDNRTVDKNSIRAGIEFTAYGKRVAYHLYKEHPGLGGMALSVNSFEKTRVPAEQIVHSFVALRAGQIRGTPWLAPIMVTLYELDQFVDATLIRQKLANMFIGWQRAMSDEVAAIIQSTSTLPGGETAPEGVGFGEIQGGTMLDLGSSGMTLEWSKPPDPAATLPDFVKMMLRAVACGLGMPYTLLNWDTGDVNYSSMRGELLEFRRRVEQFQFQTMIHQFCRPVWKRWVNDAVLAGVLPKPSSADGWNALYDVEWRTPRWAWVDPLKDVQAAKEAVRCGFTSRTAVIHESGYDPESVDAEIAADNERADELGIITDSDPRQTQANGGARSQPTAEGAGGSDKAATDSPEEPGDTEDSDTKGDTGASDE
jgi:lambda family phage portal protein